MTLKLLQLNIWKGQYLDDIIQYVKNGDFDICTFQEVTGGRASYDKKTDCFSTLTKSLPLKGELLTNFALKVDPSSYFGNATFYKNSIHLEKKDEVRLKPYTKIEELPNGDPRWQDTPYSALGLKLTSNSNSFYVINTHGAWSMEAKDTPEKIRQGEILYEYLKKLDKPFILSGDFNLALETQVLNKYELLATNLSREFHATNTLNPRVHYAKELFPPGVAVDHIFVSRGIKVSKFNVIDDVDLSDHLGVKIELQAD